jgi:biopolymer transport protein ExbD
MKLERNYQFRLELFHVMPVVNVVFLALVLFALSSRFSLQPGLTLSLPVSTFTLSPLSDPLVVTITAAPVPTLYLREQKVTVQELDVLLQNRQLAGRPVVIRADSATPYERVAEISNLALRRGFSVGLAYRAQEAPAGPGR